MGVSAAQGSAGLKQGVCTSTTRPSNPFEGQMIYETDTDLTYIYGGTAWQQVSGGTAVGNSGLVYVTSATIGTTVSSVTVSSAFSTTYDNYKIILSGGTTNTGDATLSFRLGSTATGYYLAQSGVNYSGATASNTSSNNDAYWLYVGRCLTNGNNMNIDICAPFLTNLTYITGAVANQNTGRQFSGYLNNTTSYTAFTVQVDSATITGGTITVYGYRKA